MLYLVMMVLGVLLGAFAKGRLLRLLDFKLEGLWLIFSSFAIQIAAMVLSIKGIRLVSDNSLFIQGAAYLLLIAGLWPNRKYLGITSIGLGSILNAAVIMANGGRMPVSRAVAEAVIGDAGVIAKLAEDGKHVLAGAGTRLGFLSDIMHPPGFLGLGIQVVSIGDLLVALGLLFIVFELMIGRKLLQKKI